eukprot:TRINITY_DN4190_c0_g1_i1.p1 TRINITY_DN4190_c0_g1~~TRINITY_DN4190_c0_g1_i1.p1  ORF type:complete len:396 (-),score=48.76 TRINITY_DN4190_c0_g1_i1:356-1459(-)
MFALCAFAGTVTSTVTGIGAGVVFAIVLETAHLCGLASSTMSIIISQIIIVSLLNCPTNCFVRRKFVNWHFASFLFVVWSGADVAGTNLMVRCDSATLKHLLGVIMLCYFFSNGASSVMTSLWRKHSCSGAPTPLADSTLDDQFQAICEDGRLRADAAETDVEADKIDAGCKPGGFLYRFAMSEEEPKRLKDDCEECNRDASIDSLTSSAFSIYSARGLLLTVALGLIGGFLAGLVGIPVLAFAAFVNVSRIDKDEWRASIAAMMTLSSPLKAYYFFVAKEQYDGNLWPQYLGTVVGVAIGNPVGHRIAECVNHAAFLDLIMAIVLCGGVMLTTSDTEFANLALVATLLGYGFVRRGCVLRTRFEQR